MRRELTSNPSSTSSALEELLENPRVWRGSAQAGAGTANGLASGYAKLDQQLPGGGWPRYALTEILAEQHGVGELQLLMPALARLSAEDLFADDPFADVCKSMQQPGWIAWVAPPFQPYAPALTQWGINLSRLLIVRPKDDTEVLWAAEQALSSGTCRAVLLWPKILHDQDSRRLQLAAEKGASWAVALRSHAARYEPSAAALRIKMHADQDGTHLEIFKSRGARPVTLHNIFSG
jgi:cell division inhibitor SulA/protein ImuA